MKNQDSTESGDLVEFPFDKIKFSATRADNDSGDQIVGSFVRTERDSIIVEFDGMITRIIPETLCQFSFHVDSVGNEIYDGDVLEYEYGFGDDKFKMIVTVEYSDGGFFVDNVDYDTLWYFLDRYKNGNVKVIGHLHQGKTDLVLDEYEHWLESDRNIDDLDIQNSIDLIKGFSEKYLKSRGVYNE